VCPGESLKSGVTRSAEASKIDYQASLFGTPVRGGLRRRKRSILGSAVGLFAFSLVMSACTTHNSSLNSSTSTTSGSSHKRPSPSVSINKTIDVAKSPINALSCVGSSFCMAASNGGTIYRFDGQSWNISVRSSPAVSSSSGIGNPTVDGVNSELLVGGQTAWNRCVFCGS
jgi:hypothetical protein